MERQIYPFATQNQTVHQMNNYSHQCVASHWRRRASRITLGRTGWKWNSAERIKFRAPFPGCESTRCSNTLRWIFVISIPPQKRSDLSFAGNLGNLRIKREIDLLFLSIEFHSSVRTVALYRSPLCIYFGKEFPG